MKIFLCDHFFLFTDKINISQQKKNVSLESIAAAEASLYVT